MKRMMKASEILGIRSSFHKTLEKETITFRSGLLGNIFKNMTQAKICHFASTGIEKHRPFNHVRDLLSMTGIRN